MAGFIAVCVLTDQAGNICLGGFQLKADSEGRPGTFTYGRNQADGANILADAVAP